VLVLLMLPLHSYSQKNGEKYCVFRYDCVQWRLARKQENARWQAGSAGASPLTCNPNALLARPLHFSYSRKNGENAKCTFFGAMELGHARQATGFTLTSKSGLPKLVLLVLGQSRAGPVSFNLAVASSDRVISSYS